MTKLALVKLDAYLTKADLHKYAMITNAVHDEIVIDVISTDPIIVEKVVMLLEHAMVQAGDTFCKTVPLKADAVVTPYWTH